MIRYLEPAWCRLSQFFIKLGYGLIRFPVPHCLEGPGVVRSLGRFLAERNINDVLVVTGAGMDALTHAVEAYTNQTYNTPLEDRLAREAVRLIHGNLLTACTDGQNTEARQNMQRSAFCAGRAFTRGCVGYVHAIGHTLGSLYGIAHGLAMAVLLPHVLRRYGAAVHRRLAELAEACGMEGTTDGEKADRFISWIEQANRQLGLPDGFAQIREEDIPQMIAWAQQEAHPLYPVPVIWSEADFRELILSLRK